MTTFYLPEQYENVVENLLLQQWAQWVEFKIQQLATPGTPESQWVVNESLQWFKTAFALDIWKNFTLSRSPDKKRWARLKYRSGKPLILTGQLFASSVEAARNRTRSYGNWILMDSDRPFYGIFHQYGTRNMPARPFFGPRPETVVALAAKVAYNCMRVITGRK